MFIFFFFKKRHHLYLYLYPFFFFFFLGGRHRLYLIRVVKLKISPVNVYSYSPLVEKVEFSLQKYSLEPYLTWRKCTTSEGKLVQKFE